MADPKLDKEQEKAKKEEQKKANMPIVTVCTLSLKQLLVALHEKALKQAEGKKSGDIQLTIQNSAIEGAGGKDAKFYGAGQHIIAAITKDNKGIANNKVQKKDALPVLEEYVKWFVGPDLKQGVTDKDLKPLENGAEGKVVDNHEKKEDIEKSKADSVAGEKYEKDDAKKESAIFIPSFSQYLLTEEGEEGKDEAKEQAKKDKEAVDDKKEESGSDAAEAQGWYVEYKMTIPGQKEHSIADSMKKLGADLLKAVGVEFTSLFGGGGGKHTLGELVDGLDAIFGKMNVDEFEPAVNEEIKKRMKGTDATAKIWDTPTILKHLKKEVSKYKSKIAAVKYALCVKVNKNDPSYKLFNEDAIANIVNSAISNSTVMRGLGKRLKGMGVKGKDVILVNNYDDNKKNDKASKDMVDKAQGSVVDSKVIKQEQPLIVESKKDLLDSILESSFNISINEVNNKDSAILLMKLMDLSESIILEKGHKALDDKKWNAFKKMIKGNLEDIRKNKDKIIKNSYEDQGQMLSFTKGDEAKNNGYEDFIFALFDDNTSEEDAIKKLNKICHRDNFRNDIVYRFKYEPEEKKNDIEITFIDKDPNEKDEDKEIAKVKKEEGKDIELPEEPKHTGYKFTGWDPDPNKMDESGETYSTYEEDENEEDEDVEITFMDIDDPANQDKEDEYKNELGKVKKLEDGSIDDKEIPKVPEHEGYEFEKWEPDPEDMSKSGKTFAKYKETENKDDEDGKTSEATIYFKIQDPEFKNKVVEKLADVFDPIKLGKKLDKDGKPTDEIISLNDVQLPNHKDAKDIPEGYATTGKTTWTITSTKETTTDEGLKDKLKAAIEKDPDAKEIFVVLNLIPKKNFTIKVIDVDPEKPDDESQEKEIASIEVIWNPLDKKHVYKPEDISKISKAIHDSPYPDEKYAGYLDKSIDDNTKALKEVSSFTTSSKGDYKVDPKDLEQKIENKVKDPGIKPEDLPPKERIVKVKTSYGKEQFKVKIVQPDAEDPDNTKSQKEVATITVFKDAEGMHYKADDLAKLAKDVKTKDEADKYNKAAKDNEAAFKAVDNIKALTKDNAPYKFQGWAGPKTADGKTEDLEEIINAGPAEGEEDIVVKAKFSNDIKANHTNLDFYIVPMKGLKDKDKHKDNSGSK